MDKLSSGRFWLTVVAGIILLKWAWGNPHPDILKIVEMIVIFYFLRNDRNGTNGGSNDKNVTKSN